MVFRRSGEVEGFHGVPGDGVASESEDCAGKRRRGAQIVEDEGAVDGAGGEDGGFGLVEADRGDGVGSSGPV